MDAVFFELHAERVRVLSGTWEVPVPSAATAAVFLPVQAERVRVMSSDILFEGGGPPPCVSEESLWPPEES